MSIYPIKVLYLIGSLAGGGAERTGINLCRWMDPKLVDFRIGAINKHGQYLGQIPEGRLLASPNAGLIPRWLAKAPKPGFDMVRQAILVRAMIKDFQPDVVVSTIERVNFVAYLAINWPTKAKVKWVIREGNNTALSMKGNAKYAMVHRVYSSADRIIPISCGVRAGLAKEFGVPVDKCDVIYNPVDLEQIKKGMSEPISFDAGVPFIIGVGRLEQQKGFDILLRAFALIASQIPHELVIAGVGSEESTLRKLANLLGIKGRVRFIGFQDNPWKWIANADAFVLSSRYEGFGHVVVEALACGVPVISTRCDYGPAEILCDGEYGVLVTVADVVGLSDAIVNVVSDKLLSSKLCEKGLKRAEFFSAGKITEQYQEVLLRVVT